MIWRRALGAPVFVCRTGRIREQAEVTRILNGAASRLLDERSDSWSERTAAGMISAAGRELRAAREARGITRAQLAGLAQCSLASLDRIEQGAVPRRSAVLARAWDALADIDSITSSATSKDEE